MRDHADPDNPDNETLARFCPTKGHHILNPIIDWENDDVWEFIREYNVSYCELYDQGYKRLGCIGCPMAYNQAEELEKYPKYKAAYLRTFQRMYESFDKDMCKWKSGQDIYDWWISK